MHYPAKIVVLVPQFRLVVDDNKRAFSDRLMFLSAFALLQAVRNDDGDVTFRERVNIDPTGGGSMDLLNHLGSELDCDTALGGWRLDRQLACLIRVPRDSDREDEGRLPLLQFGQALACQPVDVAWFDRKGGLPTLMAAAVRHGLGAEWRRPPSGNPAISRYRLSARARSVWAAIADKLLEQGEGRRKAFASFDRFNSQKGG